MPIQIHIPRKPLEIRTLLLDFTGTLSRDGRLLPGVALRLTTLSRKVRIIVLTADTFGTARTALNGLPVELHRVSTGADKAGFVRRLGAAHAGAIGNGRNDIKMLSLAALGIAVIGPEGAAGDLVRVADVVVGDVLDALDLLAHPKRLIATLRA